MRIIILILILMAFSIVSCIKEKPQPVNPVKPTLSDCIYPYSGIVPADSTITDSLMNILSNQDGVYRLTDTSIQYNCDYGNSIIVLFRAPLDTTFTVDSSRVTMIYINGDSISDFTHTTYSYDYLDTVRSPVVTYTVCGDVSVVIDSTKRGIYLVKATLASGFVKTYTIRFKVVHLYTLGETLPNYVAHMDTLLTSIPDDNRFMGDSIVFVNGYLFTDGFTSAGVIADVYNNISTPNQLRTNMLPINIIVNGATQVNGFTNVNVNFTRSLSGQYMYIYGFRSSNGAAGFIVNSLKLYGVTF